MNLKEHHLLKSILFFSLSFLVLLHQYLTLGVWIQIEQLRNSIHHEIIAIILFILGLAYLLDYINYNYAIVLRNGNNTLL